MLYLFEQLDKRSAKTVTDIQKWCDENLTDGEVFFGNITICIISETDAMAFELRWV